METFNLPKYDGTKYQITGTALTPVWRDPRHGAPFNSPTDSCVVQLASGEKVLYVHSRPAYPMANRHVRIARVFRDAQNMTAEHVAELTGRDAERDTLKALGLSGIEVIA